MKAVGKVIYRQSIRKQYEWIAVFLFLVILAGVALYPVNTLEKVAWLSVLLVAFAALTIWNIRKYAEVAQCPSCQVDLYDIISAARFKKIAFHYCPACGGQLEV